MHKQGCQFIDTRSSDKTAQGNPPWKWGNQGCVSPGPGRALISAHPQIYFKQCLQLSTPQALQSSGQTRATAECPRLTFHQQPSLGLGLANVAGVGVTVCLLQGADGEPQGQALLAGRVLP